ncbi:MAG: four helix bundle protein [Anaerolineae bacterium]|nr:MAG: four helix bundle protein [Anaerolineae bacterium]
MAFRFESLEIWHRARAYATSTYQVTGRFPRHEDYGLKSQLNRAVNSISLNIAEGSGRGTDRAFNAHLGIALGSLFEVVSGLFLALDQGYIDEAAHRRLYEEGEVLAKSVNAFRRTLR